MSIASWPAKKIASGGMAEVFLAHQRGLAGFERPVVVKRIRRELHQDPRFIEMFLGEARLAAQLHHPNIVDIDDVAREGDDFFLVMDYLSGEDLRVIVKAARSKGSTLPIEVAARIVADVAAGLDHAHTATDLDGNPLGIVHRDVSPSNIIVTYAGVTKLIDFGVAQANSHHIYTKPSMLKGKLAYSSPEQFEHQTLDAQSDVFSLGIVLYELLTFRRLFRGDNPATIVKAVMEQPIAPPSQHNPNVPPALDTVVMHALERDRARRTPDARAFLDELESALETSGLTCGHERVARWMTTELADRLQRRRRFENSISEEPPGALMAAHGTTASESLLPAPPDDGGLSLTTGSVGVGVVDEPRKVPWPVAILLFLLIAGGAFVFGLMGGDAPANGLLVRADPAGASLIVDGETVDSVGPDGVFVPAEAGRTLSLELALDGHRRIVDEASVGEGVRELRFTLAPLTAEAPRAEPVQPMELAEAVREEPALPSDDVVPAPSPSRRRWTGRATMRAAVVPDPEPTPPPVEEPRMVEPARGQINIVTSPTGAQVAVNGRPRGASPVLGLNVTPGAAYEITVELEGHRPWRTRITPESGTNPPIVATLVPIPRATTPSTPTAPTAPTTPRVRPLRVPAAMMGNAARGAQLASSGCGSCHGSSAPGLNPRRYTRAQWSRYFATGRHVRRAELRPHFSQRQLADVKTWLMGRAADVESDTAAGVR